MKLRGENNKTQICDLSKRQYKTFAGTCYFGSVSSQGGWADDRIRKLVFDGVITCVGGYNFFLWLQFLLGYNHSCGHNMVGCPGGEKVRGPQKGDRPCVYVYGYAYVYVFASARMYVSVYCALYPYTRVLCEGC